MNGIGYKIKKTILYILLILLSVVCMFPFLLMIVNATRSGSEIMKSSECLFKRKLGYCI